MVKTAKAMLWDLSADMLPAMVLAGMVLNMVWTWEG